MKSVHRTKDSDSKNSESFLLSKYGGHILYTVPRRAREEKYDLDKQEEDYHS